MSSDDDNDLPLLRVDPGAISQATRVAMTATLDGMVGDLSLCIELAQRWVTTTRLASQAAALTNGDGDSVPDDERRGDSEHDDERSGDSVPDDEWRGDFEPDDERSGDSEDDDERRGDSVPDDERRGDSVPDDERSGDSVPDDEWRGDFEPDDERSGDSKDDNERRGDSVPDDERRGDSNDDDAGRGEADDLEARGASEADGASETDEDESSAPGATETRLIEFALAKIVELVGNSVLPVRLGLRMQDHMRPRSEMKFWFELPCVYIYSVAPLTRTTNGQGQPEVMFSRTGDWLNLDRLGKTVHDCNGAKLYKYGATRKTVKKRVWGFMTELRDLDFPEEEVEIVLEYVLLNIPPGVIEHLKGEQILRNHCTDMSRRIIWHADKRMNPRMRSNRSELREMLIDDSNSTESIWESIQRTVVDLAERHGTGFLSAEESDVVVMELQGLMTVEHLRIEDEAVARRVRLKLQGQDEDRIEDVRRAVECSERHHLLARARSAVKRGQMSSKAYEKLLEDEATRRIEERIRIQRARIDDEVPEEERERAHELLDARIARNARRRIKNKRTTDYLETQRSERIRQRRS